MQVANTLTYYENITHYITHNVLLTR